MLTSIALAGWANVLNIVFVAGAAVALASLHVLFTSAFAAHIPTLVPGATLAAANGARATSSASAGVLGPAIAGALISVFGAPVALVVDAVSFLGSASQLELRAVDLWPRALQDGTGEAATLASNASDGASTADTARA